MKNIIVFICGKHCPKYLLFVPSVGYAIGNMGNNTPPERNLIMDLDFNVCTRLKIKHVMKRHDNEFEKLNNDRFLN